jgi:ATP-dependent Clp endopeptidase proteolytic subunit ClpP
MTEIELLSFSMRSEAPKDGSDWFRIVEAKKGSDVTKVYIYDEIGFWGTTAKDFAAALDAIDTKNIHLHVNSPGGSVFDGLAIYNTIKNHPANVTAIVDGMAASAASFLIQGADTRQISRNAQVMIHDAKAFAGGNAAQMRQAADLLDRISNEIADIYATRAGGTTKDFRDIMKAGDQWYNGNEALDKGLVDEVTDNPASDAPEEATKNVWKATDVEAFLKMSPDKLAASASHVTTTNRVEEAHMGDQPANSTTTPPPVAQPPAPAAQAQPAAPVAQDPFKFTMNGSEITDFAAVQAHINSLETFRTETIEAGRKAFVAALAKDGKIMASAENLTATEEFALSLSSEQFDKWKASMSAAPTSPLFQSHGADQGDNKTPVNGGEGAVSAEIATLEEIVQGHRDSGVPQDALEKMGSYQKLQSLKSDQNAS